MFCGKLEAERADRIDNDDFKFIRDLAHEAGDLLHQAVHGCLIAGLRNEDQFLPENMGQVYLPSTA